MLLTRKYCVYAVEVPIRPPPLSFGTWPYTEPALEVSSPRKRNDDGLPPPVMTDHGMANSRSWLVGGIRAIGGNRIGPVTVSIRLPVFVVSVLEIRDELRPEGQRADLFAIVIEAGETAIDACAPVGRIDRVGINIEDGAFAQIGIGDAHVEVETHPRSCTRFGQCSSQSGLCRSGYSRIRLAG